ncbi:hypothetical protein [Acinetobacter tandoii]
MKKTILLYLLVGLGCVGCSTSPTVVGMEKNIPASRISQPSYFTKQSSDQTEVSFLRDSGFIGRGCTHDIFANNIKIFSIRPNEKAVIYLKPDYYIFRLETGGGMCPNIATSQEAEMKPNAKVEYRILIPSDFNLRLTRMK